MTLLHYVVSYVSCPPLLHVDNIGRCKGTLFSRKQRKKSPQIAIYTPNFFNIR